MKKLIKRHESPRYRKLYIWFILYITVIISIFDYSPNLKFWLYEIGRNFLLISIIALTFYAGSLFYNLNKLPNDFKNIVLQIFFNAGVTLIGGTIGWKLNEIIFGFNVTHPALFYLMIFLITVFTSFAFQSYLSWKETNESLARKKETEQRLIQLKTKAELDALRARLNPHFLFNTINSIMSLIHSDPDKAEEMLQKLADLLRIIQDKDKKEFIKLSEELEIIGEYLAIEKIRFGDRLKYSITADDNTINAVVPAMILQPLVENSVKYGISSADGGFVRILAQKTDGGNLLIKIIDSGSGFVLSEASSGFGLTGITERLELMYGQKQKLEINNNNGCEVSLTIPLSISG